MRRVADIVPAATRTVESWFFPLLSARRLAAIRIGLCSTAAVRMAAAPFLDLAGQPEALFRPISFMKLFTKMPGDQVVFPLQIAGVMLAVLAAAGWHTRATLPGAWLAYMFLNGMATSLGKVVHNDVLTILAIAPLLVAPCADAWSLDSLRGPPRADGASSRYGGALRVCAIVVAGGYFFSGLAKLMNSGTAWVTSDNLRWVLFASSDSQSVPNPAALFVAEAPVVVHALAGMTLVVELGFPIALMVRRASWFFVPTSVALHLGIWLTMRLDYSAWIATVVTVFIDWPSLVDRLRRRKGSLRRLAMEAAGRLPPREGVRVLHISDLHNRIRGFRFAAMFTEELSPDLVVNTGDLSGIGGTLEKILLRTFGRLAAPQVLSPGNHDSPLTEQEMAGLGSVVLEGAVVEAGGLRIWGYRDPNRTSLLARKYRASLCLRAAETNFPPSSSRPVVAVHNELMAGEPDVALVLCGHFHRAKVALRGSAVVVRCGSTGGGRPFGGSLEVAVVDVRPATSAPIRIFNVTVERGRVDAVEHRLPSTRTAG